MDIIIIRTIANGVSELAAIIALDVTVVSCNPKTLP